MHTIAFCEIEPYCRAVLRKHWPAVPIFEDVRLLHAASVSGVDVICGGFPCQPFSSAARGRNNAIDLWPEMLRVIDEFKPRYVIAENVVERPIRASERALRGIGYGTIVRRIGADDAGADHARSRWWICAYADHESELHGAINAEVEMLPELCKSIWGAANYARAIRIPDGLSNRMDRNRAIGNAVVPQIPEIIGRAIMRQESLAA